MVTENGIMAKFVGWATGAKEKVAALLCALAIRWEVQREVEALEKSLVGGKLRNC